MQTIEHAACRDYFTRNYGCAVCLAICPFSQVGYEKVQARFRGNPNAPQFRIPMETINVEDCPFSYGDYDKLKAKFEDALQ